MASGQYGGDKGTYMAASSSASTSETQGPSSCLDSAQEIETLSRQPIPTIRRKTRDLERSLGEAIEACTSTLETEPFDIVLHRIHHAQSLLDQVRPRANPMLLRYES